MQVNIEEKSSIKKILHIEIPREDVAKELDKAYKELKKTTVVKGFRKGKTPQKILESRFAKDVHSKIVPILIQESFQKVLKEHEFKTVGSPKVDPPELKPDESYIFDITIEVMPEIKDINFKGIDLKKTIYTFSEKEVDAQIEMIRKNMATKEKVEEQRAVQKNDFVLIDYQGFIDDKAFDKTPKIENYLLNISNNNMPKEFSEKLIGVIPEKEIEINVIYEKEHANKELAGQTIIYKVFLKEIQKEILPPVDDSLAKKLGQYENLEEIKNGIRDNLTKGYEQRIKHELSEQIFTALIKDNQFEIPESLIEIELQGIIAETEQAYAQSNITLKDVGLTHDTLKTKYRDVAEKQAIRRLILKKIIEQEKLELTKDELEKSFENMAIGMNATKEAVKKFFDADKNQLEYYKHLQLEKKVVDIIIKNGNITEVEPVVEKSEENSEVTENDSSESKE
ncbi:MAG: trigger factor [Desulfobacteraceae bacterium 4572_130]|nr:MAG: trigger factor [Desulfobacteraceae bacterium 4572_130]